MSQFKEKLNEFRKSIDAINQEAAEEIGNNNSVKGFTVDIDFDGNDSPQNNQNNKQDIQTDNFQQTDMEDFPSDHPQPRKEDSKKRRVESFKKRIDKLTLENDIRETQNRQLMARLQEQERLLAEQSSLIEKNEDHKNAYYENNLFTREAAVLNELKNAKEEGDIEREVILSKELAEISAEKSTHNLYKAQLRNRERHSYDSEPYYESTYQNFQPNYEPPINEALDDWLGRNPWADPESPQFSPRLRGEVESISTELEEMMKFNGVGDLIGTEQYYQTLDNLMGERYGVQSRSSSHIPPQRQNYDYQQVAPVSRSGGTLADQYMASNPQNTRRSIPLSEDEFRMARNLKIKNPLGGFYSTDEVMKRFAEGKRKFSNDRDTKYTVEV